MDNKQVFKEHGPGWNELVDPLLAHADAISAHVNQVKEKFGTLRFYWDAGDATDAQYDEFDTAVKDAEWRSGRVCDMCGKEGRLMRKGGWLKTLCKDDALLLDYRERVT